MTTHLDEQQLIDYCAGETAGRGALEEHLRECAECHARQKTLERVLALGAALPVPEPEATYESRLWRTLRPQLAPHAASAPPRDEQRAGLSSLLAAWGGSWFSYRRLLALGAVAALVLIAFLAGRYSLRPGIPVAPAAAQVTPMVRERILLVAVGDHLDRAQSILLEISNTEPPVGAGGVAVDISREQQRAEQLLTANRLYRQTANQTGDAAVASVLDELEPFLAEIANGPGQLPAADLEELRRRIAARGLLLKVRVLDSEVRGREQTGASGQAQGKS